MVLVVEIDQPDVGNRDYICQDGGGGRLGALTESSHEVLDAARVGTGVGNRRDQIYRAPAPELLRTRPPVTAAGQTADASRGGMGRNCTDVRLIC